MWYGVINIGIFQAKHRPFPISLHQNLLPTYRFPSAFLINDTRFLLCFLRWHFVQVKLHPYKSSMRTAG